MASAEDYPYDSRLEVHALAGLDKLRAIKDRRTAHWLFELWHHIDANEKTIERRLEADEKRRARDERQRLESIASATKRGTYGVEAKALWAEITQDGQDYSQGALEHLAGELRRGGYQRV